MREFRKAKIFVVILAAVMALGVMTSVGANSTADAVGYGSVTFSDLDSLAPGESMDQVVMASVGNSATISLERAADEAETVDGITVWKVSYTGGVINCHFYMTVSDNKVTSVYDRYITTFGGAYDDEVLTSTSAYGKLTFGYKSFFGLVSETCWLRGTVTGNNNEITITFQM